MERRHQKRDDPGQPAEVVPLGAGSVHFSVVTDPAPLPIRSTSHARAGRHPSGATGGL